MSDAVALMIDELRAARQNMTDAVALIDELRAEVRMLQAERARLEATIARVKAMLPANERGFLRRNELLAALRGEP